MKQVSGFSILECKYIYNGWTVDCSCSYPVFSSELKLSHGERAANLWHERNVYAASGLPYRICDIRYEGHQTQYSDPCRTITREFSDTVCESLTRGDAVLVADGYCNYAPAIFGGIQRALGNEKKIGLVWIDAHPDCCIPEKQSRPVQMVGVPVSIILGKTLPDFRQYVCGIQVPCAGENMIGGDMRFMDEESTAFLENNHVHWLDASIFRDPQKWSSEVHSLADRVDAIYLSVDADILKASLVPGYFRPVPYGHDIGTVNRNIQAILETGKTCAVSLFCFDFDKNDQDSGVTAKTGMHIIENILTNWKIMPDR